MSSTQGLPSIVKIEGRITLDHITEVQRDLDALLSTSGRLVIEMSGVEDIDTAGLQLLLAFLRARGAGALSLTGWPSALRARAHLSGLHELVS